MQKNPINYLQNFDIQPASTQLLLNLVELLHGLNVVLPTPQRIIHASDEQDTTEHQARPVHVLNVRRHGHREERCDSSDDDVYHREGIDRNRELAERKACRRECLAPNPLDQDAGNAQGIAETGRSSEESNDGVESGG